MVGFQHSGADARGSPYRGLLTVLRLQRSCFSLAAPLTSNNPTLITQSDGFYFQRNIQVFLRISVMSAMENLESNFMLVLKHEKNFVLIHACKYQSTFNGCNFSKV